MEKDTYAALLGLHGDASIDEISNAYRRLRQACTHALASTNEEVCNIAGMHLNVMARAKQLLQSWDAGPKEDETCAAIQETMAQAGQQALHLAEHAHNYLAEHVLLSAISLRSFKLSIELSQLHSQLSVLLTRSGELESAREHASTAISMAERLAGEQEPGGAAALALAHGWYAMGLQCLMDKKLEPADSFLSRARQAMRQTGAANDQTARVVFGLAMLAGEREEYELAAELCHEALINFDGHYLEAPGTLSSICGRLLLFTLRCLPESGASFESAIHMVARRVLDADHIVDIISNRLSESLRTELLLGLMKTELQLATRCLNKGVSGSDELASNALKHATMLFPDAHPQFREVEQKANTARVQYLADSGIPEVDWPVTFDQVLSYASFHWERVIQALNDEYPETSLFAREAFATWSIDACSHDEQDREMAECHFTHLSLHFQAQGIMPGQSMADFYLAVIAAGQGDMPSALDGFETVHDQCRQELGEENAVTRMCKHVLSFASSREIFTGQVQG